MAETAETMENGVNATLTGPHNILPHDQNDIHEYNENQRSPSIQDILLTDEKPPEYSIGPFYLLALTGGLGGLQVVWSVILSNGSPFLVSLGLSSSLTALVWVAAPLCGVIVQPVVGILSDRSRSRWGRRRPFILAGALGVIASMLMLAWIEEIFQGLTDRSRQPENDAPVSAIVVHTAIFLIYVLNITIQPLQAGLRTLIVENCPGHQQTQASAWAGGMTGVGSILGYLAGFADLPSFFRVINLTQFQCLCLFASWSLMMTVTLSCSVKEQHPPHIIPAGSGGKGFFVLLRELRRTYRHMPSKIRKVCHIQFCAWMAWFPFLFYSTTYVGEFYVRRIVVTEDYTLEQAIGIASELQKDTSLAVGSKPAICEEAIRYGTFASFLSAIVALLTNLTLPTLLRVLDKAYSAAKVPSSKARIPQAWACAHVLFALMMFSTFFVNSQAQATFIIACTGLSWALTLWAPFAIIGNELAARKRFCDDGVLVTGQEDLPIPGEVEAGAVMGLYNMAISAPQIIAALVCSSIFGLVKVAGGQQGTSWIFRAGGSAALVAGYLTCKFDE